MHLSFGFYNMLKCLVYVFALLALSIADGKEGNSLSQNRSYVCPPDFLRLSYKCYYFSNSTATWQDAYWKCRDLHSNIATIRNGNQDKVLRRTLDHDGLVPLERWVGGRYDWGSMSWKWAASGKTVQYQGFGDMSDMPQDKESLSWQCLILDPLKNYRWSSRRCTEYKHFICQTKIRNVSNQDKKKLQKQFNVNKYHKLNEVPVPEIISNSIWNETKNSDTYDNNQLSNSAFAIRPKATRMQKRRKNKKDTNSVNNPNPNINKQRKDKMIQRRRNKQRKERRGKVGVTDKIRYRTYYEGTPAPLYPRVAVEEFSYR